MREGTLADALPEFDWERMEEVAADELCTPEEHEAYDKCVACMAIHGTRWALQMRSQLLELRKDNAELNQLFELQYTRSMAADEMWRKAHPGMENVRPDLGALLEWLMGRISELEKQLDAANLGWA